MDNIYRIIDVNINRVSEGLRLLEDYSRFYFEEPHLTEEIKKLRHIIRKKVNHLYNDLINKRNADNDIGLNISQKSKLDNKDSLNKLIMANFKRVQEGLRVIEENFKLAGYFELSKNYEKFRYISYSIEKQYSKLLYENNKNNVLDTDIYGITAEKFSNGRSNIEVVKDMIDAGIKIIQYREKEKNLKDKYEECLKIRELTKKAGVNFIVNDNIDLAILVGADGVHIGQDDLPIEEVRKLVGNNMIIGLSTHSPSQAKDAVLKGADYIGVGPIYKTFTKKDVCDPVGLEYLDYVVKNIDIPFVAIGGIKENNVEEVVKKGAKCVSMVTEIVGSNNIQQKVKRIRNKIKDINNN